MRSLPKLLQVVVFVSFIPIVIGLQTLSAVAKAWESGARTMAMVAAGAGMILWGVLISQAINYANKVLRRRAIAQANLSAAWQRNKARPLEVDLDKLTLGRVPLGGDLQGLSFLGPAEDAERAPEGQLDYDSLGIFLNMKDGRLAGFDLEVDTFFKSPGAAIHAGAMGTKLRLDMSEAELVAVLGAPFWRAKDEDSVILFFERLKGGRWVERRFEFDETGRLNLITVSDTPELADASHRSYYGVPLSVDWPPEKAEQRAS